MAEELFVDITLNKEGVKSDVTNIINTFNTLNQTFNTININVMNLFGNIRKQANTINNTINNIGGKVNIPTNIGIFNGVTEQVSDSNKNIKNLDNNVKKADNSINKARKSTTSWTKSLAKIGLSIAGIRKLGQTIGSMVHESADWIENLNLFEVTFGNASKATLEWAQDFSKQLGYSINEIIKFTGLFKQLSTSIGIADDISNKLAETLTKVGVDMTSFYNLRDTTQAMEKLQAGIFSGKVLPHKKVISYANSFNSREVFISGYYKDNLEQRFDKVA